MARTTTTGPGTPDGPGDALDRAWLAFNALLDLPPHDRPARIDALAAGDADVARELRTLLAQHEADAAADARHAEGERRVRERRTAARRTPDRRQLEHGAHDGDAMASTPRSLARVRVTSPDARAAAGRARDGDVADDFVDVFGALGDDIGNTLTRALDRLARAPLRIAHWHVTRTLGDRSEAVVFLATADDGTPPVLLELLRAHGDAPADALARFHAAGARLAAVRHPHVAALRGTGVDAEGIPWFASTNVTGMPIDGAARRWSLPLEGRLRYAVVLCEALAAVHDAGLAHGALDSRTVLVDGDGHLVLVDTGLDALRATLAPPLAEPAAARVATAADDRWALGALIVSLCGDRSWPPRESGDATAEDAAASAMVRDEIHRVPRTVTARTAARDRALAALRGSGAAASDAAASTAARRRAALASVVRTLLDPDPAARHPHAMAVAEDLHALLADHAPPHATAFARRRTVRRLAVPVVLAIVAIALLVALLGGTR